MKITLVNFLLVSTMWPLCLTAQFYNNRINIPGIGYSISSGQVLYSNPSTQPEQNGNYFTLGTNSLFQLQAIQQYHAGFCSVRKHSIAGVAVLFLSTEFAGSYTLQSQYARPLFSEFHLGIRMNLTHLDFGLYGRTNHLNADLGLHYRLSSKWQMAAYISQIRPLQLGNYEQSGACMYLGLAYVPSEKVKCTAELIQKAKTGSGLICSMEYQPTKHFLLKTSIQINPSVTGFSFGYRIGRKMILETFGSYHLTLGLRSGIQLTVYTGSKR
jgi:hypothetical protein